MNRKKWSGVSQKAQSLIKLMLGIIFATAVSFNSKAGWTEGDDIYEVTSGQTNDTSTVTTNTVAYPYEESNISLSDTQLVALVNGETTTWANSDVYTDSGVGVSVDSGATSSMLLARATIIRHTQGAAVGINASATFSWDGPPSGPQGTSAESPTIHLSVYCTGSAEENGTVSGGSLESASYSASAGSFATIGILSSGGADDFYLNPAAAVGGLGDTSPTANSWYALVAPYAVDTNTYVTNWAPALTYESDQEAECDYTIELDEDTVLDQGSTVFTATVDINNSCSATTTMNYPWPNVDDQNTMGGLAAAAFSGSASVGISGIILH